MKRLNFTEINFELSNLPVDTGIDLYIFSSLVESISYHYICSAIDAIVLLTLFKTDYTFIYYLKKIL